MKFLMKGISVHALALTWQGKQSVYALLGLPVQVNA